MTPDTLVGLLAEPGRLRVFAAVALGARTDAETVQASGLPPREVAAALRRLVDGGALVATPDGWEVALDALRQAARDRVTGPGPGEQPEDRRLSPFVVGRTLAALPAAQARRRLVLEHVAATSFEPGERYDERAVDVRLRPWCEGGEVDHVALRRYLVEAGLLLRGGGVYALPSQDEPPAPGAGERLVRALGLS